MNHRRGMRGGHQRQVGRDGRQQHVVTLRVALPLARGVARRPRHGEGGGDGRQSLVAQPHAVSEVLQGHRVWGQSVAAKVG
eukprot:scaffold262_cov103-Isochrysis_galbana.AAC.12